MQKAIEDIEMSGYPAIKSPRLNKIGQQRAAQPVAAADSGWRRADTGRSLSQAFGLATVLDYHRRAAELNPLGSEIVHTLFSCSC